MQKYVIAGLCAALLLLGWLYRGANNDLAATKTSLAAAEAANESNRAAVARLERSMENTDKVLAGWNEDRTTLAGVRSATRQSIREAMRDETFKAWASSPAPDDAWRLFREATLSGGANENDSSVPSGRASGGLPGNADPATRQ